MIAVTPTFCFYATRESDQICILHKWVFLPKNPPRLGFFPSVYKSFWLETTFPHLERTRWGVGPGSSEILPCFPLLLAGPERLSLERRGAARPLKITHFVTYRQVLNVSLQWKWVVDLSPCGDTPGAPHEVDLSSPVISLGIVAIRHHIFIMFFKREK